MSRKFKAIGTHFDIAILGDSLASRLSAALLAKRGCRVIVIHDDRELQAPWLTSSLLMDRLLDLLDGRSCRSVPFPFQVITRHQRVEFNGKHSLGDELSRELPAGQEEVATFLDDMKALGEQLEDLLWEQQGLPRAGITNRLRFRKDCFRADIPGRVFRQSLRERMMKFDESGARKLLAALFCGVSFTPANRLTLADCALIWSSLSHQGGIIRNGLDELLWHRYRQFHGAEEELYRLARVRTAKDGTAKFLFEDERVVTADRLVFADRETIRLCEGLSTPEPGRPIRSHLSGNIRNRISPLLNRHVIVDGHPPLRLTLEETDSTSRCLIEHAATGEHGLSSPEQIEQRLAPVLPFVDLALTPAGPEEGLNITLRSDARSSLLSGHDRMVFDQGRKFLCSGAAVLPELGTVGEVLAAVTVTNRLLQANGRPSLVQ